MGQLLLPRYLSSTIEGLSDKFQCENFIEDHQHRKRSFTPKSFLLTMIELVGGRGKEGYDHALTKVFGIDKASRKSAFSSVRAKISFKFIADILRSTISDFDRHRPTYRGMIIYAVDGWQCTLPRTKDLVDEGFTGRKTSKYRESYMPKGFITHAYDVLSETTKSMAFNNSATELADALSFVDSLEKNSITLYDRAYFSKSLCVHHLEAGNYFIARCKSNSNAKVQDFFHDNTKQEGSFFFKTKDGKKKVWLIKIYNKKTGETVVFATNLPRKWRNKKTFENLYQLRWGAETSFYLITSSIFSELQNHNSQTLFINFKF